MTVEKTVTLDGKKDRPYHVAGEHEKFSVTWGPFPEEKKIQIALYWTDTSGNELEPIDAVNEVCSSSLCYSQLMNHFYYLCVHSCPMTTVKLKSLW